ncbi:unnamed protein product [Rotaria sp. Silwood2]|nr:unnamed protein product [Rotaria sp. Silwood2]CAF3083134.1 unnamed protein product [Rotaria sp. Silwood2]CAF3339905.1 unnamed protein product [Rotaria sp. Silwood2]CAF3401668.1 unnamed protein product [Rotaria sp. Silwood2]CAF4350391.1 unnamed protein product [Rotaria sp. Silwood2]
MSRFALKSRIYSDYDEIVTVFSKIDQTFDRYLRTKNIYSIELSFKQFHQHRLKPIRDGCREITDELVDKYGPYTMENDLNQIFLVVKQYEREIDKI